MYLRYEVVGEPTGLQWKRQRARICVISITYG
jgi:hypothetical protein